MRRDAEPERRTPADVAGDVPPASTPDDAAEVQRLAGELRLCQRRLARLLDQTPNLAIEGYDREGRVTFWNRAAERIFGWTEEEARGLPLDALILGPEAMAEFRDALDRVTATGQATEPTLWTCRSRQGEERTVLSTILPDEPGAATPELVCVDVDVTEHVRTARALERSEQTLRALIDLTRTGYVILDGGGRVLDANDEYVRLTGRAHRDDVLGHTVLEWTAPHDLARNATEVARCFGEGHVSGLEVDYVDAAGRLTPVELNASCLDGPGGRRILTLCRDISERRRGAEAREQQRVELAALVEARTRDLKDALERLVAAEQLAVLGQFAGSVAHEIRNPLGVIANTVYLLGRTHSGDPKLDQAIDRIARRSSEIAGIIDSMMNLTRADEPRRREVDLGALARGCTASVVAGTEIVVDWELPASPVRVWLDPPQIEIAIRNLVLNAAQAMDGQGRIGLRLELSGEGPGREVTLRILDSGPGIDPRHADRLFQPFFTTRAQGFGLGLHLVKLVIEKHGGTVTGASRPEGGAEFVVRLPARQPKERP